MRPGDLVRPLYLIELCEDLGLVEHVVDADSSHLCLVLEEVTLGAGLREPMGMLRVLTPSGVVGWQCAAHFEEVPHG